MGGLEKMRPRLSKRYFVELRTGNGTATPKSGPVSLRSDRRQGSKPASRRSARASLRVLDCVLAPAAVLSSGSLRFPFLSFAQFRCYEFSLVLEVMPPQKILTASLVARNFLARIKK